MSRTFKTVDYDRALDLAVRLGDCLPPDHLARFVVDSVAQLDLSALYARYGRRGIEPYVATGRDPHHPSWQYRFAPLAAPPPEDASAQIKMAYKLKTTLGKAIYSARKCTVEPVIGIIKEVSCLHLCSIESHPPWL